MGHINKMSFKTYEQKDAVPLFGVILRTKLHKHHCKPKSCLADGENEN